MRQGQVVNLFQNFLKNLVCFFLSNVLLSLLKNNFRQKRKFESVNMFLTVTKLFLPEKPHNYFSTQQQLEELRLPFLLQNILTFNRISLFYSF